MSKDWVYDIHHMHSHFGHHEAIDKMDDRMMKKFLKFRIDFLQEELDEMKDAGNPEDVVDALIDLVVVAIGTLDAFSVNPYEAWDKVLTANMSKKAGYNPSRPNELGLPDLIKPEGWQAPSHEGNHGTLKMIDFFPRPCEV